MLARIHAVAAPTQELQVSLADWLFQLIGEKGTSIEKSVANQLIATLCRLAKLGWLDVDGGNRPLHQQLPDKVMESFLQACSCLMPAAAAHRL